MPVDATPASLQQRLDANYRLQRHIYDLTRRYYLLGRDQMLERLQPPGGGAVLEIGCGTARNLVRAAERYPDCEFFGIDLSQMMLDIAKRSLAKEGLRGRVAVAHGDATSFDPLAVFGRRSFDRVFFSYSLSMIPEWRAALAHGTAMLVQNGALHVVDFGRLEGLPPSFAHVLRWWLRHYHVTPRDELESELQRLANGRRMTLEFEQPFRTYASLAKVTPRPH